MITEKHTKEYTRNLLPIEDTCSKKRTNMITERHIKNIVILEDKNLENFSTTMLNVPTSRQLEGHDCNSEVTKAVMLLWETSGRGKFAQLSDILINDSRRTR